MSIAGGAFRNALAGLIADGHVLLRGPEGRGGTSPIEMSFLKLNFKNLKIISLPFHLGPGANGHSTTGFVRVSQASGVRLSGVAIG
jgi:hypothetical protein